MTEQQTEEARIASIDEKITAVKDEVLSAVRDMIAPLQTGGKAQAGAADITEHRLERGSRAEDSLESMVDRALTKALGAKESADKDAAHAAAHAKLEEAQAERPPMERTRRHKVMGWGEPAQ